MPLCNITSASLVQWWWYKILSVFVFSKGHICDQNITKRTSWWGGLEGWRQNNAGVYIHKMVLCAPSGVSQELYLSSSDVCNIVLPEVWDSCCSSSQVNGWDMTMVTHDQARKKLTKKREDVVRLLVTRKSLQQAVKHSMSNYPGPQCSGSTITNSTLAKD